VFATCEFLVQMVVLTGKYVEHFARLEVQMQTQTSLHHSPMMQYHHRSPEHDTMVDFMEEGMHNLD
jgi:hypothetical protein